MLLEELVSLGLTLDEAKKLANSEAFHHKRKNSKELRDLFENIATTYNSTFEKIKKNILSHPIFSAYNHKRVVREGVEVYGDEEKVKKAILTNPSFAGLDHERVVRDATKIYGDEEKVKKAIMRYPQFAGLDHERVIRQGVEIYGDENKVKKAILKHPVFSGLNHERVIRQKTRIGRIIGLDYEEIRNYLLENSVNAGYSYKRDLARIDVARHINHLGIEITPEIKEWFMKNCFCSPYSPKTRLRISHCSGISEPDLFKKAKKRFTF